MRFEDAGKQLTQITEHDRLITHLIRGPRHRPTLAPVRRRSSPTRISYGLEMAWTITHERRLCRSSAEGSEPKFRVFHQF